ncbi:MAG: L-lactate dehydrogenase, partial [Clostridia bacterium]|nr:L-lactate dehydrogenase [Clostridia bacterium]
MRDDKRKVALIGVGMVGSSYAYALLTQNLCDELVLIDANQQRAQGEAMDLNHGLALAASSMVIYAGNYCDCKDADLAVLCAGAAQA